MAKVKKAFFCSQEGKSYAPGDEYTGKRTDVGDYLEKGKPKPAANKAKKAVPKKK